MTRNTIILIIVVAAASSVMTLIFAGSLPGSDTPVATHSHDEEAPEERGPNGGRLLEDGKFAVEVIIAEAGIPPEYHLYAYDDGTQVPPQQFTARIELERLGGVRDVFEFVPEGDYLRGLGVVGEPHSFDVNVTATHGGKTRNWTFESHEGRTRIADRIASEAGIETEAAGAQTIVETVELTGVVQANPGRVSEVRARFPGVVTEVRRDTGDIVTRGDVLGRIETNESLRPLAIEAPISGLIVNRNIQVGQVTGSEPLFVITDLGEVWVQVDVFGHDLPRVRAGQHATIMALGGSTYEGTIDFVSPLVAHGSQSVRARVPLDNPDGALRAGQFVSASVAVAESDVPLAVRRDALQTFRDFDVVYAKVGDTYEVRMLELGRRNGSYVEVLGGLNIGEVYVSANSYLVKADIEKSGATHDH
jgi:cobalt-zinc-cadmium efflux system membrane fusion protein